MKKYLKSAVGIALSLIIVSGCSAKTPEKIKKTSSEKTESTVSNAPVFEEKTVTIGSTGDILIHSPILDAYHFDGKYDFSEIFDEVDDYYSSYDYMVANLEVALAGKERGYSGYPMFNCPASIVDPLKTGGVDLFINANNHCYDMGEDGFKATLNNLKKKGMDYTGTRLSAEEKPYKIADLDGIKIGLINYTYETESKDYKALNGIPIDDDASELINTFDYDYLDDFYSELSERLSEIKNDGAEATIVYMHWGDEYKLEANDYQTKIAQKLSDMGVDAIIGGHPHVIEPVDVIHSDVSGKDTVCLYSTGNEISNQKKQFMDSDPSGHTEDGIIFGTEFTRGTDGKVTLTKVSALPTWVDMYVGYDGRRHYKVVPLSEDGKWKNYVSSVAEAEDSYNRTMKLVKKGIKKFNKLHK